MRMPKVKCNNPKCTRAPVIRGLCRACYQTAWRLVRAGKTTWESLEKRNVVSKDGRAMRGTKKWLMGD